MHVLLARGRLVAPVFVSLVLRMQLLAIVLQENQVVFFHPGWGWLNGLLGVGNLTEGLPLNLLVLSSSGLHGH